MLFWQSQETVQIPVHDVPLGLPKIVKSLCPECKQVIEAIILEENSKILMKKKCQKHGSFIDLVYSDAKLYKRIEKLTFEDCQGIKNPRTKSLTQCPYDCGICEQHKSYSCLTNIDLTNRCNLKCPICFANASIKGYVYELDKKQIKDALISIIEQDKPQDVHVVQFSGGEPTIHKDFFYALRTAKELGFSQIQIATNGIKMADLKFAKKAKENGLNTIYLQFDGFNKEIYMKTRGIDLRHIKEKAIENCRKTGITVCLVPTIVNTINNDQVGKIVQFAIDNADIVVGISFQPVSFTGRIETKERLKLRYTLSDLAHDIEDQTGYTSVNNWYPLSMLYPATKLISLLMERQVINITCHSNCGLGTYLLVNIKDKSVKPKPLMGFVDFKNVMLEINEIMEDAKETKLSRYLTILKSIYAIKKNFIKEKAPHGLTLKEFISSLLIGSKIKKQKSQWRLLFIAGMHFQDLYNYNIDRVKRCVIHYSAPDGKIYPFCSYNSGPTFREKVERQYSIPLEEYNKLNKT